MLKRLFGSKTKKKGRENTPHSSWPTAMERVETARSAQSNGNILMPSRSSASHTRMVFCPIVCKELLQRHEDCRLRDLEDGSQPDGDEKECKEELLHPSEIATRLHKPVKPNRLLAHALTNANGDAWRRQRPFVQRALGDASVTKKIAVPAAVDAALEFLNALDSQAKPEIEVRSFSLKIASATMIASVFGNVDLDRKTSLRAALEDLFHPTLLPVRGDAKKAAALDEAAQVVVDSISTKLAAALECDPCLALNLLEQELKASPSKPTLSREEVIGNCHSALLAGTQTIATTLTGAMLHLADLPNPETPDRTWFRSVVNETLRILPPVATLPRRPVDGELRIPSAYDDPTATNNPIILPDGGTLLIDVLSMAHCSVEHSPADNKTAILYDTWKFCPAVKSNASTGGRSVPNAYPWGFGDRVCPAGNLSVSCISAVLETLAAKERWVWELAKPETSVGPCGTSGWIASVSYQPTLTYPNPLLLVLSRETDVR